MDAERFDTLVRSFNKLAPRRAALGVLGGGLAALLARFGQDDAEAKKKKKRKKCKGKKKKCGKKCIPKTGCCPSCQGDQSCVDGTCVCPIDTFPCGSSCVTGDECCVASDCGGIYQCVDGFCLCPDPSEVPCTASSCCNPAADEVCAFTETEAACQGGGCPEADFCNDETHYLCDIDCFCVTSVDGATTCTTGFIDCTPCTADTDCEPILGEPGICITGGGLCEDICPSVTQFCVTSTCESGGPLRANGRRGPALADTVNPAR
jgi:hypothetical protein